MKLRFLMAFAGAARGPGEVVMRAGEDSRVGVERELVLAGMLLRRDG